MKIGFITILLSIAMQAAWGQFRLHSGTAYGIHFLRRLGLRRQDGSHRQGQVGHL